MNNLAANIIVFILLAGVMIFIISVAISGRSAGKNENNKDKSSRQ